MVYTTSDLAALFYLLFLIIMYIRIQNTGNKRMAIILAMHGYNMDCIKSGNYDDRILSSEIEPYYATLFRRWDWGHKRILPKEKYELIKDYIK